MKTILIIYLLGMLAWAIVEETFLSYDGTECEMLECGEEEAEKFHDRSAVGRTLLWPLMAVLLLGVVLANWILKPNDNLK